nr:MAG TPA: hypothetical protein [Caudoviricetes sp.]
MQGGLGVSICIPVFVTWNEKNICSHHELIMNISYFPEAGSCRTSGIRNE